MKYVVTDPGYLLDADDWDKFVDLLMDCKPVSDQIAFFKEHGITALAIADTGFGDWSNELYTTGCYPISIKQSSFCADAGMVGVFEVNDEVQKKVDELPEFCCAIFETDLDITVDMDTLDPNWTVVKIKNGDNVIATSTDYTGDDLDEDNEE